MEQLAKEIRVLRDNPRYSRYTLDKIVGFAFRRKFGLSKHFPLCSQALSGKYSAIRKVGKPLPRKNRSTLLEQLEEGLVARDEWGLSRAARESSRKNLKGRDVVRPGWLASRKVSDWQVAELRLSGCLQSEIAKKYGCTFGCISNHLRKMKFPRRTNTRRHGEWSTGAHLKMFIEDWIAVKHPTAGLSMVVGSLDAKKRITAREAAQLLEVPILWVLSNAPAYHHPKGRGQIRGESIRGSNIRIGGAGFRHLLRKRQQIEHDKRFEAALREIGKEFNMPRDLLSRQLRASLLSGKLSRKIALQWAVLTKEWRSLPSGSQGGRPKKLLPSEELAIPVRYQALRQDLRLIRGWLRAAIEQGSRRYSRDEMMDHICREARKGRIRTLHFWSEFFAWLQRHKEWSSNFLSGQWAAHELVIDFLASEFSVGTRTIKGFLPTSKT